MTYQTFISNILKSRPNIKQEGVYMERHHIIPKSLGGSNDESNLIYLTAREHFIAHKMLFRENPNNDKLAYAYYMMNCIGRKSLYKGTSSDVYEARKAWYSFMNSENDPRAKAIICLETKQVWETARKAAEELDAKYKNISQVCKGKKRTHKGLHFEFYDKNIHTDEYIEKTLAIKIEQDRLARIPSKETQEKCRLAKIGKPRYDIRGANNKCARAVINLDTMEIFSTITEASKSVNRNINTIKDCCKGRAKTAAGYHWAYYTEDNNTGENKQCQTNI